MTSKEIGGNITSDTLVQAAERQRQLHRLRRPAARHRALDQHRVVRQRLDQRQRPGPAQQQLHGRRRQQQRRRDRAARGHAGAHADRGDPGVPGHHRPVRRRVRPHLGRGRQRRHQGRHQQLQGSAFGFFQDAQPDREGLLRASSRTCPRPTRSISAGAARSAGRSSRTRCTSSAASSASRSTAPNTIIIPARPDLNDSRRRGTACGTRSSAAITRSTTTTPTACAGCASSRRRSIRSSRPARRPRRRRPLARSRTSTRRSRSTSTRCCRTRRSTRLRVTWTRENVTFANNCFNGNGRDLSQCQPTLAFQDYIDQQDNTGAVPHQRRHPGRRHAGLVHARQARRSRPRSRRCSTVYSAAYNTQPGQPERHVRLRPQQRRVQRRDPRTYPDRLTIRVGGPSIFYQKAHYVSGFVQDKWRLNNPHAEPRRCATTSRSSRFPRRDDPLVERRIRSTRTTSSRASA